MIKVLHFLTDPRNALRLIFFFLLTWVALGLTESYDTKHQNDNLKESQNTQYENKDTEEKSKDIKDFAYRITQKTIDEARKKLDENSSLTALKDLRNNRYQTENDILISLKKALPYEDEETLEDIAFLARYKITWKNDIMGHWLIAFLLVLCIIIVIINNMMDRKLKVKDPTGVILKEYRSYILLGIGISFVTCIIMTYFNFEVVDENKYILHWQNKLWPPFVSFWTAFGFYVLSLFPFFSATIMLSFKLFYFSKLPEQFKDYDYRHYDNMFGLSNIGNYLVVYAIVAILGCLPTAILQHQKYEISTAFYIGPILLIIVIYLFTVRPLWNFNEKLSSKKYSMYSKALKRKNELESQLLNSDTMEQLEVIQLKLEVAKEKFRKISELRTFPLSFQAKVVGFVGAVGTIGTGVLALLESVGILR